MKKALALLIVLLLAGCTSQPGTTTPTGPNPSAQKSAAPDFELENVAGGILKSNDLKGKVTVVDFWATWCEPCISEIPNYNALRQSYNDKGVEISRQVVGVGAIQPGEGRSFSFSVEVFKPGESKLSGT